MCVYRITNSETGASYIGQSVSVVRRRWVNHLCAKGKRSTYITNALKKHGRDAFVFEVIDTAESQEQLDHKERFWITHYKTLAPTGYNLVTGGAGGRVYSQDSKEKMSASAILRAGGRIGPARRRRLMSESEKAEAKQERLRKMGESKRGKPTWLSTVGLSKETREAMRLRQIGRPNPRKWKPVVKDDGTEYASVKEAVEKTGCNRTTLMRHLAGKLKTVYGSTYRYKET